MEEKAVVLEQQLDSVIQDATSQINSLQSKYSQFHKDQEHTKRKTIDLEEQLSEKSRQLNKLQVYILL